MASGRGNVPAGPHAVHAARAAHAVQPHAVASTPSTSNLHAVRVHAARSRSTSPVPGYPCAMDSPELDPEQEEQKLDDLGRRIEHARAEIDDEDPKTEHRQTFVSSG